MQVRQNLFLLLLGNGAQNPTTKSDQTICLAPMIKKCEAIVLRSIDYRDESKILTLYTKEFGKLSAIAKGCRSMKSKYASALELGSHISIVLYKKSTREVQNISEASLKTPFLNITSSLERLGVMLQILELTRLATEEEEANPKIFHLLLESLRQIDVARKNLRNIFFFFQTHFVALLGFKPSFEECVVSGKNIAAEWDTLRSKDIVLLPERGGVALCKEAERMGLSGKPISAQAFRWIQFLSQTPLSSVENLYLQASLYDEVAQMLDAYLSYHIEHLPPLRSREIFNELLR
jgi:DNA repair protein RecO (recombination protein O)